jgi:hypothetical protein
MAFPDFPIVNSRQAKAVASRIPAKIDDFLRDMARSDLLDADPEKEQRAKERKKKMKHLEGLTPGDWHEKKASK